MTFVNACCSYSWDAVPVRSQDGSFGKPTDLGWVASDILPWRSESNPTLALPFASYFHFSLCFTVDSEIGFLPRGPCCCDSFRRQQSSKPDVLPMQRGVTECAATSSYVFVASLNFHSCPLLSLLSLLYLLSLLFSWMPQNTNLALFKMWSWSLA